jgi:hypothetical protein
MNICRENKKLVIGQKTRPRYDLSTVDFYHQHYIAMKIFASGVVL